MYHSKHGASGRLFAIQCRRPARSHDIKPGAKFTEAFDAWYGRDVPSQIEALEFERYRGFRDPQQALISRLTLVYGENNAGKSAMVRVPPLLANSRVLGRPGLVPHPVFRGAGFLSVRWRGSLAPEADKDLILGIRLSDGTLWRWTFEWVESRSTSLIRTLEVCQEGPPEVISLLAFSHQNPENDAYTTSAGDQRIAFDGLIPRTAIGAVTDKRRADLSAALDGVTWLCALRRGPSREGSPRGARGTIAADGAEAAAMVLADKSLRAAVSSWFLDQTKYEVDVESLGSDFERLVLRPKDPGHDVPFPDAGEGLQQVFPVIVALERLRQQGGLLAIEEPESHLHPRLQMALVQRMVAVLADQPSARIILETHSEVFLLAALSAATKTLQGKVGLFWAEVDRDGASSLEALTLDEAGRPTTPRLEQAFSTMGVMRRQLLADRKAHGG